MKKQLLLLVTMLLAVVMPMKLWAADGNAEPYAILSQDSTVLTFFYDDQKDLRGGMSVGPFVAYDDPSWYGARGSITTVVFDDSFANCTTLTSTARWFAECSKLTTIINISNLKTDNVTSIFHMFAGCSSLTSLDVSGFNTDNVTAMNGMFLDCSSLTTLDVANFNTANVTAINAMFSGCSSLTSINVSGFNTSNVTEMGSMFSGCSSLTSLDVRGFNTDKVTSMSGMFNDCSSLTNLDVTNFNTSKVTTMNFMFNGCSGLTNLDVTNFKTDNVYEMNYMFMGCSGLTSLDISGFKTDNVYDMRSMFRDCSALTTIYAGDGWNTANVTEGGSMFYNCTNLVGGSGTRYSADHSSYTYAHIDGGTSNPGYFTDKNASPVVDIAAKPTFAWEGDNLAISTTTEGASIYYSVKETITEPSGNGSLSSPYNVAAALQYINTLGADTTSPDSVCIRGVVTERTEISTTYGNATFYITDDGRTTSDRLLAYRVLNVGNQKFTTENAFQVGDEVIIRGIVYKYRGMTPETYPNAAYIYAYTTKEMNMLYENPIAVTDNVIVRAKATKQGMNDSEMAMFSVGSEPYAVLSENNTKLIFYYDNKKISRNGMGVGPFTVNYNTETNTYYVEGREWEDYAGDITTVEFDPSFANCSTITNMAGWFFGNAKLQTINGLEYLNTSNVTDMDALFDDCTSLTSLDLSTFDTHNVTDMRGMFYGCTSLITLNVTSFNTSNVRLFNSMFNNCTALKSIDVSNFDTRNATSLRMMFRNCISLEALEIRNFETPNVTDMYHVFSGLRLPGIDLSKMNTEKVETMEGLFYKTAFSSLDLSGFNTSQVKNMYMMFTNSSNLQTIYVGDGWSTSNVTDGRNMFSNCNSLVGSAGTPYDSTCVDVTYAHIDGGENNPGYLTWKGEGMTVNKLYIIGSGTAGEWNATTEMPFNDATKAFEYTIENTSTAWITFGIQPFTGEWDVFNSNYRYAIGNGNVVPVMGQEYQLIPSPQTGCVMIEEQGKYFISVTKDLRMTIIKEGDEQGTNIYVESEQAPYLYAFDANDQALNGDFPGNQMTRTVTIDGKQFWTTKISSTDPFNINIIDGNQYRTREIYVISDRYFTYLGLSSYRDVTEQYANAPEIQISSVALAGNHNEWGRNDLFTEVEPGKQYTMDVDLTNVTLEDDVMQFKLYANACAWLGITSLTLEAPSYVHSVGDPALGTSNRNFYMDLKEAPTRHFKFKAVWRGGTQMEEGWTLTITEVNQGVAEPYAVLSDNNTKLTFFYDTEKDARGGMGVGPFDLDNYPSWYNQRESITTVEFDDSFANCTTLTSTVLWFYNCGKITSFIGISNLKTDNVMDMGLMFSGCSGLTSLDLSSFNTTNVMSMNSMFSYCSGLTSLEVGSFNTANVDNMLNMFYGCSSLTSLDVSRFNTANVTVMSGMFQNCSALTTIDVSNFNTEKVTGMTSMFADCYGLTSVDVSHFNTANVTRMGTMFGNCSSLTSLDLSSFNTANVTDMYYMFSGCRKLVSLDISNFDMSKVSNEERNMFEECFSLASIIAGNANILTEEYANIGNPNLLVYVNEARLAPSNVQNVVINGLAREIVLTDAQDGNNDWYAPQAFVAERISYTRNFGQSTTKGTSRGWESIALPFDVQTIQHESKGVIAPFNNSASNKHFWLRRLTDNGLQAATNIEANTPYIISMPNSEEYTSDYNLNGRVTFSAQNIDVPATTTKVLALADSSIVMVPAMQRQSRSSSVWALNVGEVRGQYFEGSVFERDYRTVRPFEAYTIHRQENGQPAPRYVPIQEIAGVTGIETIDREPLTLNQWYDMQGRKLEGKPARKGVYISNGKKVVVK